MRICVTSDLHGILPKIEEPCTAVLICGDIMPLRMQRNIPQSENKKIGEVIFTADWHPANHCSFKRNGGEWNDHCVQFSKGAAIHDLLLYGCIGSGVPYRVLIKGELPSSEEYGVKVAPATARVKYDTIYSNSIGIDVDPENQIVVCGLAGDYCVLETLKNLEPIKPMVYLDGIASLDGGIKLNNYIESNNTRLFEL